MRVAQGHSRGVLAGVGEMCGSPWGGCVKGHYLLTCDDGLLHSCPLGCHTAPPCCHMPHATYMTNTATSGGARQQHSHGVLV